MKVRIVAESANLSPDRSLVRCGARWGFTSVSRFGAHDRQAYGVPPGHTLHDD
jgi:AraC-like DNA-binding protein